MKLNYGLFVLDRHCLIINKMIYSCAPTQAIISNAFSVDSNDRRLNSRISSQSSKANRLCTSKQNLILNCIIDQETHISSFLNKLSMFTTNDKILDQDLSELRKSNAECLQSIQRLKTHSSHSNLKNMSQIMIEEGKCNTCELAAEESKYYKIKSRQMNSPMKVGTHNNKKFITLKESITFTSLKNTNTLVIHKTNQ